MLNLETTLASRWAVWTPNHILSLLSSLIDSGDDFCLSVRLLKAPQAQRPGPVPVAGQPEQPPPTPGSAVIPILPDGDRAEPAPLPECKAKGLGPMLIFLLLPGHLFVPSMQAPVHSSLYPTTAPRGRYSQLHFITGETEAQRH